MKKIVHIILLVVASSANAQSKNVGINKANAEAALDVKAENTSPTSKVLELSDAQDIKLMTVLANGKVGVGTTSPASKLEVNGYVKLGSADTSGDANPQPGMIRYNATIQKFQGYTSSGWVDLH